MANPTVELLIPRGESPVCDQLIGHYPWSTAGDVLPTTRFGVCYDDQAVYIAFEVSEKYVLARTTEWDGPVYLDSCVEFFFTPGESGPYFNIEVSAAGGMKFNRQTARQTDVLRMPPEVRRVMNVSVDPLLAIEFPTEDETLWRASYEIPWALLEVYGPVDRAQWRGNFYKCAEENGAPHFGSWSPIQSPAPDFHRPEFFGCLRFLNL